MGAWGGGGWGVVTSMECVDGVCVQVRIDEAECAVDGDCYDDGACDEPGGCDGDLCTDDACLAAECVVARDPTCVPTECDNDGDCVADGCRLVECVDGACIASDCDAACGPLDPCEDCAGEGGCEGYPCTLLTCKDAGEPDGRGFCRLVLVDDCPAEAECEVDDDCAIDGFCAGEGGCDGDTCTRDVCLATESGGDCAIERLPDCVDDRCESNADCRDCPGLGGCDGDPCTAQACVESHCRAVLVDGCGARAPDCQVAADCETDSACAGAGGCDGDLCTVDACFDGSCTVVVDEGCGIYCEATDDCEDCPQAGGCDGNTCTQLSCIDRRCVTVSDPSCDEGACLIDSQCDDGDDCTEERCDEGVCEYVEIDCDEAPNPGASEQGCGVVGGRRTLPCWFLVPLALIIRRVRDHNALSIST